MVNFTAVIDQFDKMGEKTGWTYISIPAHIAQEIKPDCRVSFRVKGKIDSISINGIAILPMGKGEFILALKKELQKKNGKRKGAVVNLSVQKDKEFKIEMPDDLAFCLEDVEGTLHQFNSMPKSHRNYYFNWINSAKTEPTRVKRLAQTVDAMIKKMNFSEMIKYNQKNNL